MVSGEAASRILLEVMSGVLVSTKDSPEEAEYRKQVKVEVDEIHAKGGTVQLPREWL